MMRDMKPGAVIVDLASEAGGNCAVTEAGKDVFRHGVTVLAPLNVPASMPTHASQMYARNMSDRSSTKPPSGRSQEEAADD
jgi:NAD(P) transhydrogenase subunit alpha